MFANVCFVLFGGIALASAAGEPEVECPAPRSPPHGQAFLKGGSAKIVCDPGFRLVGGREVIRCLKGKWEHPFPTCTAAGEMSVRTPIRPLFEWGEEEGKKSSEEGDVRRMVLTARELEDEERKRTGTTVAKRPLPREAVMQNDKGETYLRHMYYHNNYYYHHQQPQQVRHLASGGPLSESQMAWIHSLPPDLRDQYLRSLYRGPYYHYNYYDTDHYLRQPQQQVARVVVDQPPYDYTCNRAGWPFVAAPKVAHAHVTRYDRRHGAGGAPFLAAVYRCDPGYALATPSAAAELYCSRRRWRGDAIPRCLPN